VTISGSGFSTAQGSGQVWLGTANGVVQSWSDTQVVALVANGSTSGNAKILQNGVWSNAVPFNVSTPHITSVSPGSGSAGTSVTITGTGFGSFQGTGGAVVLGSIAGQVVSWNDTQVVAAVATGSLTGIVRIQQNGVWSNALSFTVPVLSGTAVTLVPNLMNLSVGDTRTIQALGSSGQSVTGLTWTSSDTSIVSLSTDDPPVLTALAAGHATITAGTASADVTVWTGALPLGTVTWSNPGNGSGVARIVPAVPSASGVADVFAFQNDGTVQAITSDGITAWTADASNALGLYSTILPDFQGGLILSPWDGSAFHLYRLDGMTGQRHDYNLGSDFFYNVRAHTDGAIFVVVQTSNSSSDVVGLDLLTGAEKFRISPPELGSDFADMIVAGDGYAYMPYIVHYDGGQQLKLLQVSSGGGSQVIGIADHAGNDSFPFTMPGGGPGDDYGTGAVHAPALIGNGADGVLLSWMETIDGRSCTSPDLRMHLAAVNSGGGVTIHDGPRLPGQDQIPMIPVLQRQDGTFVGAAWMGGWCDVWSQMTKSMAIFDASGSVLGSVSNEEPMIATADNEVIGKSGATYDQNGSSTGQNPLYTQSWTRNMYQGSPVAQVAFPPTGQATPPFSSFAKTNQSGNSTSPLCHDVRDQLITLSGTLPLPRSMGSTHASLQLASTRRIQLIRNTSRSPK
jgi:hypothetical protein